MKVRQVFTRCASCRTVFTGGGAGPRRQASSTLARYQALLNLFATPFSKPCMLPKHDFAATRPTPAAPCTSGRPRHATNRRTQPPSTRAVGSLIHLPSIHAVALATIASSADSRAPVTVSASAPFLYTWNVGIAATPAFCEMSSSSSTSTLTKSAFGYFFASSP